MSATAVNDFGTVAEHGDYFEFHIDRSAGGRSCLIAVIQTERGPRRTELTDLPTAIWRKIGVRAVRELVQGMSEDERTGKKTPNLMTGTNRLSPLIGRELALLLLALQEQGAEAQLEAILHGWRELAREERWWLYTKAAAPGQQSGTGWRRALFHALSETTDTRAEPSASEKKSPKKASSHRPAAPTRSGTAPANHKTAAKPTDRPAARRKKVVGAASPR